MEPGEAVVFGRSAGARATWLGACLAGAAVLSYLSIWQSSFLGMTTEGWFVLGAQQILEGRLPYRDFHFAVPPLGLLELAAVRAVFGDNLMFPHLLGMLERAALAVVLYLWLARLYSPTISMVAAVASVIVASGDIADTVWFYHFIPVLWGVIAGSASDASLERLDGRRAWKAGAFGAGAAVSLAFFAKQTTGAGLTVALGCTAVFLVWQRRGARKAAAWGGWYAGGWSVVTSLFVLWFVATGMLRGFLISVFLEGPTSKGGSVDVLLRPLLDTFASPSDAHRTLLAIAAAIMIAVWAIRRYLLQHSVEEPMLLLCSGLMVLLCVIVASRVPPVTRALRMLAVHASLWGSGAIGAVLFVRIARDGWSKDDHRRFLLAVTCFACTFGAALSWHAWELMAVPTLAFLLCEAARGTWNRAPRWGAVVVGAGLLLIVTSVWSKLYRPYSWGDWIEPPVSMSTAESVLPELAGFRMSPGTAEFVDTATLAIMENSRPDEPIFVFPNMMIFYVLADRDPVTFALSHWFDVAPERVVLEDVARLKERLPAVVVNYEINPAEWQVNEANFRDGEPSAQRQLEAEIHRLTSSAAYRPVVELRAPMTGNRLRIWALDRSAAESSDPVP